MKTKLPISTITYNTERFLKSRLDDFLKSSWIEFYIYIWHKGEQDQYTGVTDKDHIHLFLKPASGRQTEDFRKELIEPVSDNLPLKPQPFRLSNLNEWFLYDMHFQPYLNWKGLKRQFEYNLNDFRSSEDLNFLNRVFAEALEDFHSNFKVQDAILSGVTWQQALGAGIINARNLSYAKELYKSDPRTFSYINANLAFGSDPFHNNESK